MSEGNDEYTTSCKVDVFGRALGIDLRDAGLETQLKDPHMTLVFNRNGGYGPDDVAAAAAWIAEYLAGLDDGPVETLSFTTEPWGKRSDLIHGPLEALALAFRQDAGLPHTGPHREPHVALRK